jgi:hypothetical protein
MTGDFYSLDDTKTTPTLTKEQSFFSRKRTQSIGAQSPLGLYKTL